MHSTFSQLREILLNEFTEAEVEVLCDKVGISFTDLSGTGIFGKTRELLLIAQQHNRLDQLKAHVRAMRPNAFGIDDLDTSPKANNNTSRITEELDESNDQTSITDEEDYAAEDAPINRRSSRGVARETEQVYEVAPQPRTLLPFILIAVVATFSLLIVFLPGLLRGTTEPQTSTTPTTNLGIAATRPIPVVNTQSDARVDTLSSNTNVVIIATPAPFNNTVTESTRTQNPPNSLAPTLAVPDTGSHPAAIAIQRANDLLPAYYRGEMDSNLLAEQWAAEALRITIAWNEKLPAVMKIKQSPRSKLEISYNYIQQPRVTSSRSNTHIVATTEYWSYSNPSARTQICDTRDYVYTVIEANGKFMVADVTSKLIDKKCK
jgi:hypothetical protein